MTVTKADLQVRVLQKLQVIASDETPSAADAKLAGRYLAELHAEWDEEGLVDWRLTSVPDHAAFAYVAIAANRAKAEWTVPADVAAQLPVDAELAERRFRKLVAKPYSGNPTRFTAY